MSVTQDERQTAPPINVRLDADQLAALARLARRRGRSSRSALIREAVDRLIRDEESVESDEASS
ncbi:MAG TPA: ribbon-helix-helix protein, CopG family [Thermomicrobiales bacterium]|nr:ribbon-helix-helix protein, CopG family [Thermomicrobiales bacterium]HRA33086.1 ribbon-helix-helix protein, CopG family [Thermomicrobiales bacterium]